MSQAWRRVEIAGAGVSIDTYPEWPVLEDAGLVYQRGPHGETASVRWGADATIEHVLAHVGLGSAGTAREVEEDVAVEIAGTPGRRVRLRVNGPDARPGPGAPSPEREVVYVFAGFIRAQTPVLAGYRIGDAAPESSRALLEHVLDSIEPSRSP
jgi:hypothetical protein